MNYKFIRAFYSVLVLLLVTPTVSAQHWTLQSSITQAMIVSPELKQSNAEIGVRNAELQLSDMWPDPSIELKVDNQVGLDTGSGDYALSEITISQDIPLSRMGFQTSVAEAKLSSAKHLQSNFILILQNRVAKVFYELQLASAIFELAGNRVNLANQRNAPAVKDNRSAMVRYLTPLEKMRLSIILEKANQAESAAEGKLQEVLLEFHKLLGISSNDKVTIPKLSSLSQVPDVNHLARLQNNHPLLSSQLQKLQAATSEIDVARSSAMKDPSISINRLRENFSSGTENVYGIMFNIEIPIHSRKKSSISKANYKASLQRIELAHLKRNLKLNLDRSYAHMNHMINQAAEYKKKVLKPASIVLDLSDKGFISGEINILSLIDANSTYFESQMQYFNLVYQSWLELAQTRLHAGVFLASNNVQENIDFTGVQ